MNSRAKLEAEVLDLSADHTVAGRHTAGRTAVRDDPVAEAGSAARSEDAKLTRPDAHRRLELLATSCDPSTFRHLEALGVAEGWRCLEVGAGTGSVARWLATRVGPSGHVVATDLNPELLSGCQRENLSVLRHDIVTDPLPRAAFDIVHIRLVLMHLAQRDQVLSRLIAAVRPGGWLVVEDHEFVTVQASPSPLYSQAWPAMLAATRSEGMEANWARRLPGLLQERGLTEVGAAAEFDVFNGGSPSAKFWKATWQLMREPLLQVSGLPPALLDVLIERLEEPGDWFTAPALLSVWGRGRGHDLRRQHPVPVDPADWPDASGSSQPR